MRAMALLILLLSFQESDNPVDKSVEAALEGTKPASLCEEGEFLRRVTLDLTGAVPRIEETKAFLAKPDRARLVDRLLASEDFDAWWARFLLELTTERRAARYDNFNGRLLYDWLRAQLKKRRPYDDIVRELIAAKGNGEETPAVNFLLRYNVRPSDVTGAVGRAFLGIKLQCAQCHDHPFDTYLQEEFWGVAAFFARTKRYAVEDTEVLGVTDVKRGKVHMPGDEKDEDQNPEKPKIVAKPRWIGKNAKEFEPGRESRADLAKFVTGDPLFAKNAVNRIWARLMGRGLVEPLDNFGAKAKPSHPDLLHALAEHFVTSGYDLRATIRLIVTSKAYQRSSKSDGSDPRRYARATLRPLTTDQLYLSIVRATHYGENPEEEKEKTPEQKEEELDNADYYPAEVLGVSPRSLRRALSLLNRGEIHEAVGAGATHIVTQLGEEITTKHFEYLYLALLSRLPTRAERKHFEKKNGPGRSRRCPLGRDQFRRVPEQPLEVRR